MRAWNNLGVLYYTSNRFADATTCFSKAITLGDREPTTFGLLGFCLEKEGNVVAAEMAYMQALSGAPTNSEWKEGLLRICVEGKQFGRAESIVRNLIKERPLEKRFWLTHAGVLLALERKRDAAVVLETAMGIGAAGAEELLLLGDLYADQNLATEAVAVYEKALGPARGRGEQKLLRLARAQIGTGELTEAEQTLGALKNDVTPEGRLALWQSRADLLIARQRWSDARAEIEELLKVAPLNGQALLTLGRTYAEEDDIPRAMLAFEAAYHIAGSTYRASLELAGLELKNRRYAKSVEYLEKALSIQKSEAVEDYLARIRTLVPSGGGSG
jgi:tetratricopeptide (TPR) repeat protein